MRCLSVMEDEIGSLYLWQRARVGAVMLGDAAGLAGHKEFSRRRV